MYESIEANFNLTDAKTIERMVCPECGNELEYSGYIVDDMCKAYGHCHICGYYLIF